VDLSSDVLLKKNQWYAVFYRTSEPVMQGMSHWMMPWDVTRSKGYIRLVDRGIRIYRSDCRQKDGGMFLSQGTTRGKIQQDKRGEISSH